MSSPLLFLLVLSFVFLETLHAFAPSLRRLSSSSSPHSSILLHAKKSKTTTKKSADVTVRLLQDSKEGLGQKGTIVKISAALWANVYQPKKLAERITEEEERKVIADKKATAEAELQNAISVKTILEDMDSPHRIEKKVGANGQLFGGVKQKDILEIVKWMVPTNVATNKWAVVEFKGEGDSIVENQKEIRVVGTFSAMLNLHPDVKAKFKFDIVGEK